MSRGGGANRAVQMRANTQWFNPDDFDESAYSLQNDAPFRRLGGRDDGNILSGGNDVMHSRGAFPSTRAGAGRGTATGGRVNGRGGVPLGPPRLDLSASTDLTANGTLYGGSSTEMLGRNSMGGGGADFLGCTSQGGGPATDILGRTTLGGSALGGRPPSSNRSTLPPPAQKLGTSGDIYAHEAVENGNVGGGGRGMLRRMGSGMQPVAVAAAGGGLPLPGPMGPLAAVRGPPPPDHIPDRPGTVTTTTTQSDLEGRTIVTKSVITRTNSGRMRTEVTTTTSGPAYLINGTGHGGSGMIDDDGVLPSLPPPSPGGRLAQGSGLRAARSGGGSVLGSPEPAATSPVTPPGGKHLSGVPLAGAPSSPGGGGMVGGGGGGGGGFNTSFQSPPLLGRRPSQTGLLAAPPVRPLSGGRAPSIAGMFQAPAAAGGGGGGGPQSMRSTWGGAGGGSTVTGAAGGGAAAVATARMSASPVRVPPGGKVPAGSGGSVGDFGSAPGRAPSAGRLRMSPGFAAAHALGNGVGAGAAGAGVGAGGGGGHEESYRFPRAGGGDGHRNEQQRPSSGRYGGAPPAVDYLLPPSSPENPDWSTATAAVNGRFQQLSRSGGSGPVAVAVDRFASAPLYSPWEGGSEMGSQQPQGLLRMAMRSPGPAVRPGSAVRSPSTNGMVEMAPSEVAAATAALGQRAPPPTPPSAPAKLAVAPPMTPKPSALRPAPPGAVSPKAAAAAAMSCGGSEAAAVRSPQPPPSRKPASSDGTDDGTSKFRHNMGKAVAAAKMMGVRRNAGQCAVSLSFLRRFRAWLMQERPDASSLTTSQVVQEVIKPMTASDTCRLTDLRVRDLVRDDDVGPPEYFISHAWSMSFLQLLDCFFNHLQGALDSTRVWLDIFAVNQHPGAEQKDDLENLRTAIALSEATLVCLDSRGTPMERVWCLYEFDNTLALKGADALVLLTPGFSTREIASIFRSIDVDAAKATVLSDKQMILDDIRAKHGSTEAFNAKLKLRFLLDPLDAKPDMIALTSRAGTDASQWNLGPVVEWLKAPGGPQVAVLTAAPGTGKSTITAVLCMGPEAAAEVAVAAAAGTRPNRPLTAAAGGDRRRSSTPGSGARLPQPVTVHAYHFCKYSDARRQDPVRVVKTLAYQLAQSLPALRSYYCELDPGTLMQLNQPDTACRELLVWPLQKHLAKGQEILLVLDALDEADKAPQPTHSGTLQGEGHRGGDGGTLPPPSALDNKVLQLLLHQMSLLPSSVRILATIRPDPHLLGPLRSRFPDMRELTPEMLRRSDKTHQVMQTRLVERFGEATARQLLAAGGAVGGGGGQMESSLVYFPVVALLGSPLERVPRGVKEAFGAVFAQPSQGDVAPAGKVKQLLEVLVAAQEPPPMSLLAGLGLSEAREALPGWGVLFYERDHAVHVLHRTLIDWLEDPHAAGPHHADARRGHALLGRHLLTSRPLVVYGARYLVTHLIKAGSEPALLDAALQDLAFLEAACRTGDVFKLHAELASLPPERTTDVVADVARWLGLNGAVLWSHPQSVTQVAAEAPRCSSVWQVGDRSANKNAVDMLNEPYFWPLEVMALTQHKAAVPDVTYSPDGRLMVSASLDGSIRLWDAATGEPKAVLAAPPAQCLSYSLGGELVATGGDDGLVTLWDPSTGLSGGSWKGHKDAVTAVAFSPDGLLLASGSRDKMARMWNTDGGGKVADLKGHTGPLLVLAFSPDGAVLASAAHDDAVPRLWKAAEGQMLASLEGHRQGVLGLAFSPAGGLLATAADNVRLWDAASGAPRGALTDHIFPVAAVAFTPDGATLVSADTSHTLRLWGIGGAAGGGGGGGRKGGGRPKGRGPPGVGPRSTAPTGVVPLAVLEAESGGQLTALAVSPDGGFVATGSAAGELHVFAVELAMAAAAAGGGSGEGVLTVRAAHAGQVRRLAFSPNSHSLVSASDDCTLRLWDPRSALAARGRGGGGGGGGGGMGQFQAGAVTHSVHFSRTSPLTALLAASVGDDGTLSLWDGASGEALVAPQRVQGAPRPRVVRLSPEEEVLAVGEMDGSIRLWDLAKGGLRARLKGHTDVVNDLEFCALNPGLLISGSEDCRVRLWNTANGRQVAVLTGHTASVTAVALSVDGTIAASGDDSGAIRVWPIGENGAGRAAAVLKGHSGAVLQAAFCPADGGLLASAGADYSVRLWDVGGGKQLAVMSGHKEAVSRLVWGPVGRLLTSGSRGEGSAGSVFVWDCRTGKSVYSVHAAYMAPEDGGRPGGMGGLCTVVSALEHAPHLTLIFEAAAVDGPLGPSEVEAADGLLRLRHVPLYTSFAAPSCVAVAEHVFTMAFGSQVYFYRVNESHKREGLA